MKGHIIVAGLTESGKTTWALQFVKSLRSQFNPKVLVLDPNLDEWDCDFLTNDSEEFLTVAKQEKSCYLVVDESGESLDKWDERFNWLGTRSRHWGHKLIVITQRASLISATIRGMCSNLIVFEQNWRDAKIWAEEFNDKQLLSASELTDYNYILKTRGKPARFQKLDLS